MQKVTATHFHFGRVLAFAVAGTALQFEPALRVVALPQATVADA
jgi:hypothetical protein